MSKEDANNTHGYLFNKEGVLYVKSLIVHDAYTFSIRISR